MPIAAAENNPTVIQIEDNLMNILLLGLLCGGGNSPLLPNELNGRGYVYRLKSETAKYTIETSWPC